MPASELHLEDEKLNVPLALEDMILCKMWLTDIKKKKNRRYILIRCSLWEHKEKTLAPSPSPNLTQNESTRVFTDSLNPKNSRLLSRFWNVVFGMLSSEDSPFAIFFPPVFLGFPLLPPCN